MNAIDDQKQLPRTIILGSAAVTIGIGCTALLGWIIQYPLLASYAPGQIPMAPSGAVGFILLGAAVLLRVLLPQNNRTLRIGVFSGSITVIAGLSLFSLSLAGIHPDFEHPGMVPGFGIGGVPLGHLSIVSALCFVLAGCSFLMALFSTFETPRRAKGAFALAGVVFVAGFTLLLPYFFGVPLLYGGTFIPPALPTAIAFIFLGMAMLLFAALPWLRLGRISGVTITPSLISIVLVIAIFGFGIVISGYSYYRRLEKEYRVREEKEISAIADLKVSDISHYRGERLGDASMLYDNALFSDLARHYLDNPGDLGLQKQLREWFDHYVSSYQYDRVSLLDPEGIERLAVPDVPAPLASIIARRFPAVLDSGKIVTQDFYQNEHDGKIYLAMLVPIFSEREHSHAIGCVMLRIDPRTFLYPFIKQWPTNSRTSETMLLRRESNDALFLNDLRFEHHDALTLRIPLTKTGDLAVQAVLGKEGVAEGVDYRGNEVLACIRAIPNSPWVLVARTDISEIYAPLRQTAWLMSVLLGTLLFIGAAGIRWMWKYQKELERRQREEELRESEESFRTIFENNSAAMCIVEADTTISMVNDEYCKISGFDRKEIIGKSWTQQIPSEDLERLKEYNRRRLIDPNDAPNKYEVTLYNKNREIKHALMSISMIQSKRKLIASLVDITERKQAEERLQTANMDLVKALAEVRTLSGMLPICANCKKIRDDKGYWNQIEAYIVHHTDASFTHGICPDCEKKFLEEMGGIKNKK
jgi:PAS domain S-box-containing protein